MKQVPSADFRKTYTREKHAIEVTSYDSTIAVYIPVTSPLFARVMDMEETDDIEHATPAEASRMSIRPVKGTVKKMVATEKRIIDPMDIRERVKAEEAARFGKPELGRRIPRPE